MFLAGPAMVNQVPRAAIPAARVTARTISLPRPVPITPVSAVSAPCAPVPAPAGAYCARPAPVATGAGVTTGNRLARLPVGLGTDRPGTVLRGNCGGRASGPVTRGSGVGAPLAPELPDASGPERGLGDGNGLDGGDLPGEGDGDLVGDGEGLGEGDWLGDGDGLGEGDLLGEGEGDGRGDGEGLGEGDLLGDGDGLGGGDLLGDGDGLGEGGLLGDGEGDGAPVAVAGSRPRTGLAAAPVLLRTATRIPAATAPPPASAHAPARARPGTGSR